MRHALLTTALPLVALATLAANPAHAGHAGGDPQPYCTPDLCTGNPLLFDYLGFKTYTSGGKVRGRFQAETGGRTYTCDPDLDSEAWARVWQIAASHRGNFQIEWDAVTGECTTLGLMTGGDAEDHDFSSAPYPWWSSACNLNWCEGSMAAFWDLNVQDPQQFALFTMEVQRTEDGDELGGTFMFEYGRGPHMSFNLCQVDDRDLWGPFLHVWDAAMHNDTLFKIKMGASYGSDCTYLFVE